MKRHFQLMKENDMRYTIHAEHNAVGGIVTSCLNIHNKWCLATKEPAVFKSVREARKFFFSPDADLVPPVGSCIWIRGPRGGIYSMKAER